MSLLPHAAMSLLPDTMRSDADGQLSVAGWSLPQLAREYGTPVYIFDRATIEGACRAYWQAFRRHYHASNVRMLYAAKAYLSPHIARIMQEQGLGLDVASGGELLVAQRADCSMERVSFHGNNKTEEELRLALRSGVGRIVLDNWSELERLTRIADEMALRPSVLLRVAPAVETETHRYLQTGHAAAKFGFPLGNGEAQAALLRILREGRLHLAGLHAHTGTMLREGRPYAEAIERLFALAEAVHAETNWWPEEISPGGGWAVDTPDADPAPGVEVLAQTLQRIMEQAGNSSGKSLPSLVIEPGRSIIARAGVALYRIGARKETPGGVTYLFVDGGMGDNIRPALYGAQYTALAVEGSAEEGEEQVCVSGRYCESGDMLIEQVRLPHMREGALLLLPTAGAYCLPMASNYNLVPRPAVLLVDEDRVQVMERRETYADLMLRYGEM